jgi:hypothetical protein
MLEQLIVNVNRIEKSFDVCTFERNDVVQLATTVEYRRDGISLLLTEHFAFLVGFGIA